MRKCNNIFSKREVNLVETKIHFFIIIKNKISLKLDKPYVEGIYFFLGNKQGGLFPASEKHSSYYNAMTPTYACEITVYMLMLWVIAV